VSLDQSTILQELEKCSSIEQLEQFFATYISKTGLINAEFKNMKELSPEERKERGWFLKALKATVEEAYNAAMQEKQMLEINKKLMLDPIDISLDLPEEESGFTNLLAQERRHVENVARGMWFKVEYGHQVVTKKENFYDLNIPGDHPATEMHDTIYLEEKAENGEHFVLRTHNTCYDIDNIKKYGLPTKAITVGRVYRYEKLDATHDAAFWQVDCVYVDKNVTIAHFKGFIDQFLEALFGEKKESRLRPAYFPFVEPGFEIDVKYNMGNKTGDDNWVELLWAWMLHPHVIKAAWLDPEVHSGFAFGMWLSRLVAIKHGIKDIRLFTNGDMRFVKSFG